MLVEIEDELYQVLKKVSKSMNLSISDYIRANLYIKALTYVVHLNNNEERKNEKSFCSSKH
jgi:negative regulator of replication initiation